MPSSSPDFNLVREPERSKVTIFWLQDFPVHASKRRGIPEPKLQPFKSAAGTAKQEMWLN